MACTSSMSATYLGITIHHEQRKRNLSQTNTKSPGASRAAHSLSCTCRSKYPQHDAGNSSNRNIRGSSLFSNRIQIAVHSERTLVSAHHSSTLHINASHHDRTSNAAGSFRSRRSRYGGSNRPINIKYCWRLSGPRSSDKRFVSMRSGQRRGLLFVVQISVMPQMSAKSGSRSTRPGRWSSRFMLQSWDSMKVAHHMLCGSQV